MIKISILCLSTLALATITAVITHPCYAAYPKGSNSFYPSTVYTQVIQGDDKPYAQARSTIDTAMANGQDPNVLAERYKATTMLNPNNSLALFQWAYAARKAELAASNFNESKLIVVLHAMDNDAKPHPYNFVRTEFLIATDVWPSIGLKNLGERLLAYDPHDASVIYELIVDLGVSLLQKDRMQAVSMAEDFVRQDAKAPHAHSSLAGAYSSLFYLTRDKTLVPKAIAEYQKYLQLAPPNDNFRHDAAWKITILEKDK